MASPQETLLRWLQSIQEDSDGHSHLSRLEDLTDVESDYLVGLTLEITGGEYSNGIAGLEKWLAKNGMMFVVDRSDPVSIGKAALGAAVHCDDKQKYVRKMMELEQDLQATLMILIDEFNQDVEKGEAEQLKRIVKRLEHENMLLKSQGEKREDEDISRKASVDMEQTKMLQDKLKELERKLKEAETHIEELEADAEERREELAQVSRVAEDKVLRYEEEVRAQADELDVARAKAAQLVKAEAKISKLMLKLEETTQLRNQLKDLQEQSQASVDKNSELEAEIKTVGTLKQQLETYKNKAVDLESQVVQLQNDLETKDEQVQKLTSKLKAAADLEKFMKDQLDASKEAIAQLEAEVEMSSPRGDVPSAALESDLTAQQHHRELASAKLEKRELEQRISALEKENEEMRVLAEKHSVHAREEAEGAGHDVVNTLKRLLKEKESECLRLVTEKEKLQNYVKQTLMMKQQQYKGTLQAKQAELDEKNEMIQNFKAIREEDEAMHRREQRLVMSSFYEIGLELQRRAALRNQSSGSWLAKQRKKV